MASFCGFSSLSICHHQNHKLDLLSPGYWTNSQYFFWKNYLPMIMNPKLCSMSRESKPPGRVKKSTTLSIQNWWSTTTVQANVVKTCKHKQLLEMVVATAQRLDLSNEKWKRGFPLNIWLCSLLSKILRRSMAKRRWDTFSQALTLAEGPLFVPKMGVDL